MEQKVIFRDNQEVQSADFINQQDWAQAALDHVILDTIESGSAYSGFRITKTAQTVVSLTPGRLYNAGAVYAADITTIDLFNALPIVTQRRVAIVAWGQEIETDTQPRDFLVDASSGRTQPQSVPMQDTRICQLSPINGIEAPDPAYPTTDVNVTVVAYVLLDPTGVVDIEQFPDTMVENLRDISTRTTTLETWRGIIGSLVDTLKTDLGNLAARLSNFVLVSDFQKLADKVVTLWEKAFDPGTYIWYGTDYFLDESASATTAPGYDCKIEEGVRFAPAGQVTTQLALLNPQEPSLAMNGGFAIPAYTNGLRLDAPGYEFEERFLQWSFRANVLIRLLFRARRRHRCGKFWVPCPDAQVWWYQAQLDPTARILSFAAETWETVQWAVIAQHNEGGPDWPTHTWTRGLYLWVDQVVERYWAKVFANFTHNGQTNAQCFFNAQDGWLTQIGLYFTRLAAAGDITVMVTQTNIGCPAEDRIICRVNVPRPNLLSGKPSGGAGLPGLIETQIPIPPTFLEAGQSYAIVVVSSADHYYAMCANAAQVIQGNFFHSGDSGYVFDTRGRLMKLRLYFAKFGATRVEVPLQPLQLAGGITSVEVLSEHVTPAACEIDFEVQVAGNWVAFAEGANSPDLSSNPAMLPFRMVLRGTPDLMPGISITPSEVYLQTHKNTFRHICDQITLGTPTTHVKVLVKMDEFNAANHSCTCHLTGTGGADEMADVTDDVLLDGGSTQRTFTFNTASITKFEVVVDGTTNGTGDLFHLSQEIRWAT